jgi:hypothetical protein
MSENKSHHQNDHEKRKIEDFKRKNTYDNLDVMSIVLSRFELYK